MGHISARPVKACSRAASDRKAGITQRAASRSSRYLPRTLVHQASNHAVWYPYTLKEPALPSFRSHSYTFSSTDACWWPVPVQVPKKILCH